MKCPNCNFEYKLGEKNCKVCGRELSSAQNPFFNIFIFLCVVIMAFLKCPTCFNAENFIKYKEIIPNKTIGTKPAEPAKNQPVNWGFYMKNIEKDIKRNWNPPKDNKTKRIVAGFSIAKDGSLISRKIIQSSGIPDADRAALKAIDKSAPFKPLPSQFKGASVPIEFTFDYNVRDFK